MSWVLVAYILAGLFFVFYVLPNGIWWITVRIDRYYILLPPILTMRL